VIFKENRCMSDNSKKTYYYALGSLKRQHEKRRKRHWKRGVKRHYFLHLIKETVQPQNWKKLTKNINNWTEDINENQLSKNLVLVLGYANSNKKNDEAIPFCCFYYYLYFNLLHVYLFDTRVVMVIFQHFLSVLWLI